MYCGKSFGEKTSHLSSVFCNKAHVGSFNLLQNEIEVHKCTDFFIKYRAYHWYLRYIRTYKSMGSVAISCQWQCWACLPVVLTILRHFVMFCQFFFTCCQFLQNIYRYLQIHQKRFFSSGNSLWWISTFYS